MRWLDACFPSGAPSPQQLPRDRELGLDGFDAWFRLQRQMPTMRAEMLRRCLDASEPAAVCDELRVGLILLTSRSPVSRDDAVDFDAALLSELRACCALMRAALCSPDERLQISAAALVEALCSAHGGKHIAMVVQQPGLVPRLVELLTVGAPSTRRLATIVLGKAADVDRDAVVAQTKDPTVLQMLAVLSRSKHTDVQLQAQALLTHAGRADDIKALAGRGVDSMFAKPWPSPEFTLYQQVRQWRKPPKDLRNGEGEALVGLRIFVEGHGEGIVRAFHHSSFGASEHTVDFDLVGEIKTKLKPKKNKEPNWLVPPNESDSERQQRLRNHWAEAKGGKAMTTRVYTRGASVHDICAWLQAEPDEGGIRCFYAGLVAELELDGEKFLLLDASRLAQEGISDIDGHLSEMVKAVGELQGYLGRYILDRGRSVHKSATCVLIYGEDRETVLKDGTLQRVAIKCMRNREQFETEVRKRQGLDLTYVVGALRVHTPTVQRGADGDEVWAFSDDAASLSVELHRSRDLDSGADRDVVDERVRGYSFVIIMECAECDLGSDISHGHYAGRDKARVQHLLREVAMCFLSLEQRKLIHGDVKCVLTTVVRSRLSRFVRCSLHRLLRFLAPHFTKALAVPQADEHRAARSGRQADRLRRRGRVRRALSSQVQLVVWPTTVGSASAAVRRRRRGAVGRVLQHHQAADAGVRGHGHVGVRRAAVPPVHAGLRAYFPQYRSRQHREDRRPGITGVPLGAAQAGRGWAH